MGRRIDLHQRLCEALGSGHVYFQPPANVRMSYPCIVYKRSGITTRYANDKPYSHDNKYDVTVIDHDPDSLLPDRVANMPKCRHTTSFVKDNLYHNLFTIYD